MVDSMFSQVLEISDSGHRFGNKNDLRFKLGRFLSKQCGGHNDGRSE